MKNLKEVCEALTPPKRRVRMSRSIELDLEIIQTPKRYAVGFCPDTHTISLRTAEYVMSNFTEDDDCTGVWVGIDGVKYEYLCIDVQNKRWRYLRGEETFVAGGCYD